MFRIMSIPGPLQSVDMSHSQYSVVRNFVCGGHVEQSQFGHTAHVKRDHLKSDTPNLASISLYRVLTVAHIGVSQIWGYFFGGLYGKDFSIFGAILGSPYFRKLPYSVFLGAPFFWGEGAALHTLKPKP